jgi:hypothetical protein
MAASLRRQETASSVLQAAREANPDTSLKEGSLGLEPLGACPKIYCE